MSFECAQIIFEAERLSMSGNDKNIFLYVGERLISWDMKDLKELMEKKNPIVVKMVYTLEGQFSMEDYIGDKPCLHGNGGCSDICNPLGNEWYCSCVNGREPLIDMPTQCAPTSYV